LFKKSKVEKGKFLSENFVFTNLYSFFAP